MHNNCAVPCNQKIPAHHQLRTTDLHDMYTRHTWNVDGLTSKNANSSHHALRLLLYTSGTWTHMQLSVLFCVFVCVYVCAYSISQVWRPLLALWSSRWRSCQMWWSSPFSASVSLPSLVCSSSWEICGKSVSSGPSTSQKYTRTMAPMHSTGMSTSWMTVSLSFYAMPKHSCSILNANNFNIGCLSALSVLAINWIEKIV